MRNGALAPAKLKRYRRAARPAAIALCALAAACGSANRSRHTESAKAAPPAPAVQVVHPARLFVLPEHVQASSIAELPDGTRQIVARGMRLLDYADGSLARARDVFPGRGTPRAVVLPDRLGGGYLFAAETAGGTDLWRAPSFTGALTPLARVSFEVEHVVSGFDRLYLIERRTRDVAALDVESGQIVDTGPLPSAPGYASLAFANAWFGAVQVPFRGVLVSFDAGASWNPLPLATPGLLALDAGELTVTTSEGSVAIDASGAVRPYVPSPPRAAASDTSPHPPDSSPASPAPGPRGAELERVAYGVLGRRPLVDAVLHGVADTPGTALVAANGALARVRLSDGKLLESRERAYPGTSACHGLALETGHGFVCGEERGGTAIYRLRAFELEPVLAFDDARVVTSSGNGALVVRGSCSARENPNEAGVHCVRTRAGQVRQIHVPGALGIERVVALGDGRVAVITPPRPGADGSLTLLAARGPGRTRVALSFARSTRATSALSRKGLWLNGFVEDESGALLGWVTASGPFAGVRVHLDGRVDVAPPEHDIDRALLAGPLGIVFGGTRLAAQTIDHGFTWREVELPSEWAGDDNARRAELSGREQGCSPLGCVFGPWLRVGWHARRESTALPLTPTPPKAARLSPGGGRWLLRCAPTGELLRAQRTSAEDTEDAEEYTSPLGSPGARRPRAPAVDAPASGGWPGLFDLAPPPRSPEQPAFHVGTEHKAVQVHGYVWGGRATSWDRGGKWQVYVADPFAVRGAWSTLPTRSPWADATVAAQAFGADPSGSSSWDAVLDPLARAGALAINSRGALELFLLEEERGIVSVRDAGRQGFFSLAGVVKLGQVWYIGAEAGSQSFRILRVEGGRASVLGEYPLYQLGRSGLRASVVRSSAGDRLGVWVRGGSYYVFPVNTANGTLGAPLEIPAAELARTPRACTADAHGWVLKTLPSETSRDLLEPNVDAGETRLRNLEARLIVDAAGVCLDALAAQAERSRVVAKKVTLPVDRLSAPLVASERRVGGQRWGFRCAP